MHIDTSEGYESVADHFMAVRSDIGTTLVRSWARDNLPPASSIADIGCGSGVPISQALIEDGFTVFGIDASLSLLAAFRRRFPNVRSACEAAQDSAFFHQTFDAAVAVGLIFLLPADDQRKVIGRVANVLNPGGRFLFTAPWQTCEWRDVLTGRLSRSLGKQEYDRILRASGMHLVACHQEENHFYDAIKPLS